MPKAIALANNDVAQLVWRYDGKIPGCLGFAVHRKEEPDGQWEPLPAWVAFEGQDNSSWTPHTTEEWPVQKFEWRDLTADRGKTYSYRIVPTTGSPGAGAPLTLSLDRAVFTNPVTLTPDRGSFRTYFNRGILSTQFLVHALPTGPSGTPDSTALDSQIDQPGNPLRVALAGQIIEGVALLLRRAASEGGSCYAALYELNDPELLALLLEAHGLHLILSDTAPNDKTNQAARQSLHAAAGVDIIDRFLASGHIGHNKFCVWADSQGTAKAVMLGSTNWTDTALCAQSNNALVVENATLAAAYLDYWNRLKTDTTLDNARQGQALRSRNATPGAADLPIDEGLATVWFSPNPKGPRVSHPGPNEETPPDLAQVFALMAQARQAILFLEFQPGTPSVIGYAAKCLANKPELFVRGAVTDPKAVGDFTTTLTHRGVGDEADVVAASAIGDQFADWQRELLKASPGAHAIIHDKIVVIDPMSAHCVVVTGSHNQGYRASYNNDENLLIVRGHRDLAQAYAVHVMDVYDHYRFRYLLEKSGEAAFSGLQRDDSWQNRYFDPTDAASKDDVLWFPKQD
ncbi:phospholipase D-like domain-containing protein [Telmatospirillum sp.]|uniref:phospholipase D-like domain-containing protein n=1 Tax=Telmatospirillum sp. TaxID=2079197 RepID=UPI0028523B67|nr:phospholipase D-like domain-containing protein [Telmatospirillum sp.]MDR3437839.1 phospholipase D-like domain-containing protein [Telmatospirillum sp.]